ncbi:MAG TPA: hypothetical protein VFW21_08765 [Mycobacterium sp.]|nr:hypothetical protein [Mycobacterium sp.]
MTLSALPATVPARSRCGCGGAETVDLSTATFVRPRFFAGQLLTEDDLGSLTGYLTAKNRLHNRYLFGAGVVCGLQVNCDPCGGGTVSVEPGYALDCCGNDLVLACTTTLDVNAMIRDLRIAQLGKDCGDPCADQAGHQEGTVTRRYCLYARYAEQTTDPVAAYATEEHCGQTTCEPTRIREGISFVLKCPDQKQPLDDLWRRLQACYPPPDIVTQIGRLTAYGEPMIRAVRSAGTSATFTETDADRLNATLAELDKGRQDIGKDQPTAPQVRSMSEIVRELASLLARYHLAAKPVSLGDVEKTARTALGEAAAVLTDHVQAAWEDPLDQAAAGALLDQAAKLADSTGPQPDVVQLTMLTQGRPLTESVLAVLTLDKVKDWLLDRMDTDPVRSDCELRPLVAALPVTTATTVDVSTVRSQGRASSQLVELLIRYLLDCVCAALNPPCTPCENTDVLLACLEVRNCEVVRICNSERDYVLSGSALRYWLPIQLLSEYIEGYCCLTKSRSGRSEAATGELAFQELGFGADPVTSGPGELHLLNNVLQQVGVMPAPAVPAPRSPRSATPAVETMAADAMTEQLTALTQRVTELTDQLTETQTRLTELAKRPSARSRPATRGRRTVATGPAKADPVPADTAPATEAPPAAEPAAAASPTEGPGPVTAGSDSSEASHGT